MLKTSFQTFNEWHFQFQTSLKIHFSIKRWQNETFFCSQLECSSHHKTWSAINLRFRLRQQSAACAWLWFWVSCQRQRVCAQMVSQPSTDFAVDSTETSFFLQRSKFCDWAFEDFNKVNIFLELQVPNQLVVLHHRRSRPKISSNSTQTDIKLDRRMDVLSANFPHARSKNQKTGNCWWVDLKFVSWSLKLKFWKLKFQTFHFNWFESVEVLNFSLQLTRKCWSFKLDFDLKM